MTEQNRSPSEIEERERRRASRMRARVPMWGRDRIDGRVGAGARDVVIGKNIVYIKIGSLKIPARILLVPAGSLLIIAIAVTVLAWPTLHAAIIRWLPREPPKMTGIVNIAVADFGPLDEQGHPMDLAQTQGIVNTVSGTLIDSLKKAFPDGDKVQILAQPLSPFKEAAGEPRTRAAKKMAETIHADVIIFGDLRLGAGDTTLLPEFYVSNQNASTQDIALPGTEILGQYSFGSNASWPYNDKNGDVIDQLKQDLQARCQVLGQLIAGLAKYEEGHYSEAIQFFQSAEDDWDQGANGAAYDDGREILYQLLGNSLGSLWDPQDPSTDHYLADADDYYHRALQRNPGGARARYGWAEVRFQRSFGLNCAQGSVHRFGLLEALGGYLYARDLAVHPAQGQPMLPDLQTRASFAIARTSYCLTLSEIAPLREYALSELESVTRVYEAGHPTNLEDLAAQAYATIGSIYWKLPTQPDDAPQDRLMQAAAEFQKAIGHTPRMPAMRASYHRQLAQIYDALADYEQEDREIAAAISDDKSKCTLDLQLSEALRARRADASGAVPTPSVTLSCS